MREWMYQRLIDGYSNPEFVAGVEQFIEFCQSMPYYNDAVPEIRCPCRRCDNERVLTPDQVRVHLLTKGFTPNYQWWRYQGETDEMYHAAFMESLQYAGSSSAAVLPEFDVQPQDQFVERDEGAGFSMPQQSDFNYQYEYAAQRDVPNDDARRMFQLLEDASSPLYPGAEVSQLAAATALLNIKSECNMTDRAYNSICKWGIWWGPNKINLPSSLYDTKKLIEGLGLPMQKIDCCPNGCMLYWADDDWLEKRKRKRRRKKKRKMKRKNEIMFITSN